MICAICGKSMSKYEEMTTLVAWYGRPQDDLNTVTRYYRCECGYKDQAEKMAGEWYLEDAAHEVR